MVNRAGILADMTTAAQTQPTPWQRLAAAFRRLPKLPEPSPSTPEAQLLGEAKPSDRVRSMSRAGTFGAVYPRGFEGLAGITGIKSLAPSVGDLLSPQLDGLDGMTNTRGVPVGEHNWRLYAARWRGSNGRPGLQDRIRREDPAIQRIALMWEGPAAQERDWTVETEHAGTRAETIRASVEASLRSVRSGVGVGVVRGLLHHHLTAPWRGFALARWSFKLTERRSPGGGLMAELDIGRPVMPWAIQRWQRDPNGGWSPTLWPTFDSFTRPMPRLDPTEIPAAQVLHVTFGHMGDLPEGLGLLRPMWSSYDARALFIRQRIIGFDKASTGVPVAYYPADALPPDISLVQDVLEGLRGAEQANATIPSDMKVEFLEFPFRAADISEALRDGEDAILGAALCRDGDDERRALLIQANADACADEVNTKIVPALVAYNFGAGALDELPTLRAPRIPLMDPKDFVEFVRKGLRSGALTGTRDIEVRTRRIGGLDEMPDDLTQAYDDIAPVPRVGQSERPDRADKPGDPRDEVEPAPEDVPGGER